MIGNVWEWTSDWYVPSHPREAAMNPTGPTSLQVRVAAGQSPSKVIKGGSYLCASNYCSRYRAYRAAAAGSRSERRPSRLPHGAKRAGAIVATSARSSGLSDVYFAFQMTSPVAVRRASDGFVLPNVRFGSLADILTSPRHVRFTPNNGRRAAHPSQQLAVGL